MSDLLQQAIIDATALKEAAIKNAENTLVEKYSQEFKDTVQKLLEQEQAVLSNSSTNSAPSMIDPAMTDTSTTSASSTDLEGSGNIQNNSNSAFAQVKSAFLDGPEDELITINFDQIKSTMMEMFDVKEEYDRSGTRTDDVAKDSLAAGAPLEETEEELNLEALLDEEDMSAGPEGEPTEPSLEEGDETLTAGTQELADAARLKQQAANKEALAARKKADAAAQSAKEQPVEENPITEEDIQLSEEELNELAEELRVDLNPEHQGRGYMGSTTVEKQKLADVERAAARDDKEVKKREEEKARLADLVKENAQLKQLNDKMYLMLETLKKEVEKINVSNAKLLYTNKALANISLNERQKNQIVESISKVDSVLEAKTIYDTLQNAIEQSVTPKEVPQTLSETLNRAQTPFVVKKTASNSLNDLMAERMKALAGIKSNK